MNLVPWLALAILVPAAACIYLRRVWFFRDPPRVPPDDPGAILAPADGKVVYVRPIWAGAVWSAKLGRTIPLPEITRSPDAPRAGWAVGIYMSPLDVHYVYAPVSGTVQEARRHPAVRNWPMVDLWEYVRLTWVRRAVELLGKRHHLENERLTLRLRPAEPGRAPHAGDAAEAGDDLWVVEIADLFVNKIRCFVQPGQAVRAGQKISFISRGSQVDLIIPDPRVTITVREGMQVYGALTVLARREAPP